MKTLVEHFGVAVGP